MKIEMLFTFSVSREEEPEVAIEKIHSILTDDEKIELAYSHVRDKIWFTNKRIITMDVKGLTGNKKEYRSFPYRSISSFSIETAGTFDGDCDFRFWTIGVGVFEIKFDKKLDIRRIGTFLSKKVIE